jgi:hypothetical protein
MQKIIHETPMEFFRSLLGDALQQERVTVAPITEFYIVQLLAGEVSDGHHPTEILADTFAGALTSPPRERIRILRSVGDRALVFSGLWWERDRRPRRPAHVAYYVQLGSMAYRIIGGSPFDEMASKFEGIVDTLARVSTDVLVTSSSDVLRIYLMWQETQSRLAARALAARGVSVPS